MVVFPSSANPFFLSESNCNVTKRNIVLLKIGEVLQQTIRDIIHCIQTYKEYEDMQEKRNTLTLLVKSGTKVTVEELAPFLFMSIGM